MAHKNSLGLLHSNIHTTTLQIASFRKGFSLLHAARYIYYAGYITDSIL